MPDKLKSYGGQIRGSYKLHSKSAPIMRGEMVQQSWFTPTGLIRKPKDLKYKCGCGKSFKSMAALNGHGGSCLWLPPAVAANVRKMQKRYNL
jgi:hypothetical protein